MDQKTTKSINAFYEDIFEADRCSDEDRHIYKNYKYHLCSLSPPTMASSFILLADLKAGRCSTTAKSMFDALALAFLNKFESYGSEPRIVLATTINPKRGRLYLNSTSETHIYFDSETAVGKEMLDKLLMAQKIQRRRQKIEPLTVSELNEYVITADPQGVQMSLKLSCLKWTHKDQLLHQPSSNLVQKKMNRRKNVSNSCTTAK
ncbi:unnamed protein product [Brassica oleracea]